MLNSGYFMIFYTFLGNMVVHSSLLAYSAYLVWYGGMPVEKLVSFMLYRATLQEWFGMMLSSFTNLVKMDMYLLHSFRV
jgi:hypothetical protein